MRTLGSQGTNSCGDLSGSPSGRDYCYDSSYKKTIDLKNQVGVVISFLEAYRFNREAGQNGNVCGINGGTSNKI